MKSLKIIRLAALTVFFASFQIAFAQQQQRQEKVKLEAFDAFGEMNCDSLLGRIDDFLHAIKNNPGATGYAIIYGKNADKTNFISTEWSIYNQIESRRFDDSRLVVARAKGDTEETFTEFWLVAPGAEKPSYVEIQPDFTLSENRKPFIFNSTAWTDGPCPDHLQLKIYSDYLKANPAVRGHVVIFAASRAAFQKEKTGISTKLADKYKILPNRLKFFFVRKTDYAYTELWLVPPQGGRLP